MFLLPLYVLEQGGAPALAAGLVGLRGIGMLLMDLPAGLIAARFGDKRLMLSACLAVSAVSLAFVVSDDPVWLAAMALAMGASSGAWLLGRLSYVTDHCPDYKRGRVIAILAGTMRAGTLIGPAGGGLIAAYAGYDRLFVVAGILCALATLLVLRFAYGDRHHHISNPQSLSVREALVGNRYALATSGAVAVSLMMLRGARPLIAGLFGHALGLDAASIGLIYSLAAGIDLALFYPAGMLMDRKGRLWAATPSLLLMAVGFFLLPFVDTTPGFIAITVLLGIGNGVSTGVVMTMGSDLAPADRRGAFLGIWRCLSDAGVTGGPLLVSAVVSSLGLAAASTGIGLFGVLGALIATTLARETRKIKSGTNR